jgi:hypothetical protein
MRDATSKRRFVPLAACLHDQTPERKSPGRACGVDLPLTFQKRATMSSGVVPSGARDSGFSIPKAPALPSMFPIGLPTPPDPPRAQPGALAIPTVPAILCCVAFLISVVTIAWLLYR